MPTSAETRAQPISVVATRVVKLAVKEDVSADEIGRVVMSDPALCLRVLALVNSAAFMLRNKVTDVRQAVALIGVRGLRNLALSLVVSDMAPATKEGQLLLGNCLRRALAAQAIGNALRADEPDSYFTAGLFLDVGLLAAARDDLTWAAGVAKRPAAHRVVIERAAGQRPHPDAGSALAREYDLDDAVVDAIAQHHAEQAPTGKLAQACWLAESFAGVYEGGDLAAAKRRAYEAAAQVGISHRESARILADLPDAVRSAAAGLDRDVGRQPDIDTLVRDANKSLVALNESYEVLVRQMKQLIEEKEALEGELRAANERLAEEATTDPLTGLPNKRALETALRRDLARASREEEPLSVIVVDVDHFKRFNDDFGHTVGDEVLRSLGGLLSREVRAGDVPARFGGEEVVVVLPNTDSVGARELAERIRIELERMPVPKGIPTVTASFGVASVRGPGCEGESQPLFDRADKALYAAKESGRNRVCVAA